MRVLVVGSGGREHALVRALLADPGVDYVAAAPGNAGIAAEIDTFPVVPTDPAAVVGLAQTTAADLVVVGPEAPLVAGVADAVREAGFACFGASAAAARIEGSKTFAKDVMMAAGVPTAAARACVDADDVEGALDLFGAPYVVKADGLAAGKGVVVTYDREQAEAHASDCLAAEGSVVIEEYLDGPEVSLFFVCDGMTAVPLALAQDFKRIADGDLGPNTGGMGAYSPLPWAPDGLVDEVATLVVAPVLAEMTRRDMPFAGLLYVGLALTSRGVRVVEFNARFGDPETQVVLPRLRTPVGSLLMAAATGHLVEVGPLDWSDEAAVCVVIAAAGYPEDPKTGTPITGLDAAASLGGVVVLHAGTARDGASIVTSGGRVLGVVGTGPDLVSARDRAYTGVAVIDLPGGHHRKDIARSAALGEVHVPHV